MRFLMDCGCPPPPPRPRQVHLGAKRQIDMASFGIKFGFKAPGASDVVQRELSVTVNGGDPPLVRTYSGPVLESDEWVFQANDALVAVLVDIDGTGNKSPASSAFSYTVTDDIAPPAPGDITVVDKRQID